MPEGPAQPATGRRLEDRNLSLLLARSSEPLTGYGSVPGTESPTIELHGLRLTPHDGLVRDLTSEAREGHEDTAFLLDLGGDQAILVAGAAVRRIPRGLGGDELMNRAAAGAAVWRRERMRTWKRSRLPESLIEFSERLNRAESEADVYRALIEFAPLIVGGYTSAIMMPETGTDLLRAVEVPGLPYDARHLAAPVLPRFGRPGIITRLDASPDTGSPFSGLSPLITDIDASVLAHVPIDTGILILVDRRRDRIVNPEDWDLLGTLSRQALAALQRVRLFHEVHSLSLADPLTGLANRRQMKIVLEREMAAARRGEGLAVVMLDLDGFKEINDEQGHLAGDRILVAVADALQREARGADLVVRYGGDEFLVVLPGGTAAGAGSFVRRLHERLQGQIEVSAGIAEYAPHLTSFEHLIEAADRNLYLSKQQRKQWKQ